MIKHVSILPGKQNPYHNNLKFRALEWMKVLAIILQPYKEKDNKILKLGES